MAAHASPALTASCPCFLAPSSPTDKLKPTFVRFLFFSSRLNFLAAVTRWQYYITNPFPHGPPPSLKSQSKKNMGSNGPWLVPLSCDSGCPQITARVACEDWAWKKHPVSFCPPKAKKILKEMLWGPACNS